MSKPEELSEPPPVMQVIGLGLGLIWLTVTVIGLVMSFNAFIS
jgi:hypothetical protein